MGKIKRGVVESFLIFNQESGDWKEKWTMVIFNDEINVQYY